MPARQQGSVWRNRRSGRWVAGWTDERGVRRERGGFDTKTQAREFVRERVDEAEALRRGDQRALRRAQMPSFGELVDEFFSQYSAEPATVASLRKRLRYALDGPRLDGRGWRDLPVSRLTGLMIGEWRLRLPERSAYGIHQALRQVLNYAVAVDLLDRRPDLLLQNPKPKPRHERTAPFTWRELAAIAAELHPRWSALPVFCASTGLRPQEWMALEWGDVDRRSLVVHVRRVWTSSGLTPYGKTPGSIRAVPLHPTTLELLDAQPRRIDTKLVFPAARGGPLDLNAWREREWRPCLELAGVPYRHPYVMRHTYASEMLAGGAGMFELSRWMGTSERELDQTYGHLVLDHDQRARAALDARLTA